MTVQKLPRLAAIAARTSIIGGHSSEAYCFEQGDRITGGSSGNGQLQSGLLSHTGISQVHGYEFEIYLPIELLIELFLCVLDNESYGITLMELLCTLDY